MISVLAGSRRLGWASKWGSTDQAVETACSSHLEDTRAESSIWYDDVGQRALMTECLMLVERSEVSLQWKASTLMRDGMGGSDRGDRSEPTAVSPIYVGKVHFTLCRVQQEAGLVFRIST